jgi:hypothetical protein
VKRGILKKVSWIVFVLCFASSGAAYSHDLATDLGIAVFNVPEGADIAGMGNADAAAWGWSSNNPAMTAFDTAEGRYKNSAAINWGSINFKKGPTVNFYSLSGIRKFGENYIQVNGSYFGSDTHKTKEGFESGFHPSRSLDITWARKINENVFFSRDEMYFGLNAEAGKSGMNFYYRDQGEKRKRVIRSESDSLGGSVGILYKVDKIHIGAYWNRVWEKATDKETIEGERSKDRSFSDKFRLGASWQILEGTFIAGDYQFLNIDGTKEDQFFAGLEQKVIDPVYLYAGIANQQPTCGVGVYFPRGGFNLAFAKMDEMKHHFGTGSLVTALLFLAF